MQFLHIDAENQVSVKRLDEKEEFDIGAELHCETEEPKFSTVLWHEKNRSKLLTKLNQMRQNGCSASQLRNCIEKNMNHPYYGCYQKRWKSDRFRIESIPKHLLQKLPKLEGQNLYIAWKVGKKFWGSMEDFSYISVLISACMEKHWGMGENQQGEKRVNKVKRYYYYKGEALLFADFAPKPFVFPQANKDDRKINKNEEEILRHSSKRVFLQKHDFETLFYTGQTYFQTIEMLEQRREQNKVLGKKNLFQWFNENEEVRLLPECYQETLRRFLKPVSEKPELYEKALYRVKVWKEEDEAYDAWLKSKGRKGETWQYECRFINENYFTHEPSRRLKDSQDSLEMHEVKDWVINPETKRRIKIGGTTYLKLKEKGKI